MNAARFCDTLKALRAEWMTVDEIGVELRVQPNTVVLWVRELMAQGILGSKQSDKPQGRRGYPPAVYAVTKEWGGVA